MRDLKPPFQFDFREVLATARRKLNNRVGGVTIKLPFVSFNVTPDDLEQQVAREIVIRLADRRVLNASECCDNCIDNALESIQDIRQTLVDKQVELSKATDGGLFVLIQLMLGGIRQFLTFTESLKDESESTDPELIVPSDFRRPQESREMYFAALEALRAHLYRCLTQVAGVANFDVPNIPANMRYDDTWQIDSYMQPPLLETTEEGT